MLFGNFFRRKPKFIYNKGGNGFVVERINRFTGKLTVRLSKFGYIEGYATMTWAEWDKLGD